MNENDDRVNNDDLSLCVCACSHSPVAHIHSHGSRLPQTAVDQHAPVSPVQLGDLNGVSALIAPVQVAPDPVHRQTVRIAQRRPVQHLQRKPCSNACYQETHAKDKTTSLAAPLDSRKLEQTSMLLPFMCMRRIMLPCVVTSVQ